MKRVDDLAGGPGSYAGAMGTWPLRTLWWLCRWERMMAVDSTAIGHLSDQNVDAIRDLADEVETELGWDVSDLRSKADALADADTESKRAAISEAYRERFPSVSDKCPYEREGSDMACHRCPVAGNALGRLRGKNPGPRVQAPEGSESESGGWSV